MKTGPSEERVVRGDERFRHRTRLHPIQLGRNASKIALWDDHKFCLCATGDDSEKAITNFPSADRIANRFHFTGEFQTRNVLRITRRRGITSAPLQDIGAVQSRRVHTNANAVSHRHRWRFDLAHTDAVDPTVRCDDDRTHQSEYSSWPGYRQTTELFPHRRNAYLIFSS